MGERAAPHCAVIRSDECHELDTVLWKISSSLKTLIILLGVYFAQKCMCLCSGRLLISTCRKKTCFLEKRGC